MKVWKDEKRAMIKQKEEVAKKLDSCEDELQAYFNENAKLEKQLKQVILLPLALFLPFHLSLYSYISLSPSPLLLLFLRTN
jgi:type II secretory pathway component PulF